MSKKQIEKKFDCTVHMDYIDGFRFYQAYANDKINGTFESASGFTLGELEDSIMNNQFADGEVK